jgi:hypothetical protein
VIVLSADFHSVNQYLKTLANLFGIIIPYGGFYSKNKITVSADTFVFRKVSRKGFVRVSRYRVDDKYSYVWVKD